MICKGRHLTASSGAGQRAQIAHQNRSVSTETPAAGDTGNGSSLENRLLKILAQQLGPSPWPEHEPARVGSGRSKRFSHDWFPDSARNEARDQRTVGWLRGRELWIQGGGSSNTGSSRTIGKQSHPLWRGRPTSIGPHFHLCPSEREHSSTQFRHSDSLGRARERAARAWRPGERIWVCTSEGRAWAAKMGPCGSDGVPTAGSIE